MGAEELAIWQGVGGGLAGGGILGIFLYHLTAEMRAIRTEISGLSSGVWKLIGALQDGKEKD